ncbi:putative secondary metabolism biosynthetic enzyme [Diaporthe australafricana]|uniref:Fatty acyl-CoA reductase n=1 Tax=Diaporthe australafricana TaxID=127596 RepID=A0ABR3XPD9_9PEZI
MPVNTILLTGVTGFVGKVVLEELIRRRNALDLQFDRILVLIRSSRNQNALERFLQGVVKSGCFSRLPNGWNKDVDVVAGDLMEPNCGLDAEFHDEITKKVTHIIHCAGCVSFDTSLNVLLAENVTASLNILQFSKHCQNLQRLVVTSTAYEQMAVLPKSAHQILEDLHDGRKDPEQIRIETGHPNNYTLAKCLAEHFLVQKKGSTPLTIVRPSIISASCEHPFPGWIDSFAALAGPLSAFALGGLKVLHGDPSAILDVIPVDKVAECLINEAIKLQQENVDHETAPAKIVQCVSTTRHGQSTWDIVTGTITYFDQPENVLLYKPKGWYIGTDDRLFYIYEFFFQYLPVKMTELRALMVLDWEGAAKARKTLTRLSQVDTHFRYFVEHTYDFRCTTKMLPGDFDKEAYMQIILSGLKENLLVPLVEKMKAKREGSETE